MCWDAHFTTRINQYFNVAFYTTLICFDGCNLFSTLFTFLSHPLWISSGDLCYLLAGLETTHDIPQPQLASRTLKVYAKHFRFLVKAELDFAHPIEHFQGLLKQPLSTIR
jgi:hypothetical protein